MSYSTPKLEGPVRQYETPVLVDVADLSGAADWCVCLTSGSLDVQAAAAEAE